MTNSQRASASRNPAWGRRMARLSGGGNEQVRRLASLLLTLRRRRIAGAQTDRDDVVEMQPAEGLTQIFLDVVAECAQGRNVDAAYSVGAESAGCMVPGQAIDHPEKARESFP